MLGTHCSYDLGGGSSVLNTNANPYSQARIQALVCLLQTLGSVSVCLIQLRKDCGISASSQADRSCQIVRGSMFA
jgi:hypothetical protein